MSIVAALDKVLFFNASSKYSVLRMKTEDSSVPTEARSPYRYHDHLIRFTAVGIELPQTDTVKIEMDGEWKDGKYGLQLQVDHWQEIVPPTLEGVRNYLASGLLKGIGEKTADAIIEKFGVNSLKILEHQPDRLLEIRGITKERLAEIKDAYAETSRMRVLMTLLAPFKVTPTTAQKIYQHFGPACADIVRQSPFNLCQVPGFGFKRIDAIVQKSGGDLRDPKRVHGALFYALEDARTKDGHLYLEAEALLKAAMQLLNERIPLPQMRVPMSQVEQELSAMIRQDEVVSNHGNVYGVSNSDAYREICDALAVNGFLPDYTVPEKTTPVEAEQSDAASVQEVHQTLSMLLSMLTLIPAHRAHLQSVRGLSDDEITRFGFKSTPPPFLCRSLTNRLVKAGCRVQGVPGFYVDDNGCWTVKFHQRTSGIIIPIFGVDGLIRGAQIRLDHPLKDKDDPPEKTGVKYLTLSSTGKRMGTTSGSPIHFVGDPCSRVVYVTEGCLKADVAHALMHRTFVATLGVNNTAKLDELFAFLHRNGTEEIIEAEDMDKYSNEMVEKGASKIYALAARHGMCCRRLTWNPNYKGIDDWQLALRRKEQKMKEDPGMTFKEQYLNGLCGLEMLEACTEEWHAMKVDSISLREYLGLTEQEYDAYLQTAPGVSFRELLDSQRKTQRFRVYQLDLEHGETRAFAFGGIDALHKAGFQQPPAAEYTLVYDGELTCPVGQDERDILERIFARYNQAFPPDYRGRSIAPSDVLELYDESERRYFYCDMAGFLQVKFSPALAKKA